MSEWERKRSETIRFTADLSAEDRRVTLRNGGAVRINLVGVTFRRTEGGEWQRRVSVSHGKGWDLTIRRVPEELHRGKFPAWLADLVEQVAP
jgi:hypothetical protein